MVVEPKPKLCQSVLGVLLRVCCRVLLGALCRCCYLQGQIWQSIKWLDELGMKIIEQVGSGAQCGSSSSSSSLVVPLPGVWVCSCAASC